MMFTFYLVKHIKVSHNNTAVTIFGRLKVLNNMRFPIKVLAMRVYYLIKNGLTLICGACNDANSVV